MRVVEYGHIKPKEVKCNHCGAILEYVPNDLRRWADYVYYLLCPVCDENIFRDNNGEDLKRW